MLQTDKISEEELNVTEITNLPDKDFEEIVVLTRLERRVEELSKNFNKEIENMGEKIQLKSN